MKYHGVFIENIYYYWLLSTVTSIYKEYIIIFDIFKTKLVIKLEKLSIHNSMVRLVVEL